MSRRVPEATIAACNLLLQSNSASGTTPGEIATVLTTGSQLVNSRAQFVYPVIKQQFQSTYRGIADFSINISPAECAGCQLVNGSLSHLSSRRAAAINLPVASLCVATCSANGTGARRRCIAQRWFQQHSPPDRRLTCGRKAGRGHYCVDHVHGFSGEPEAPCRQEISIDVFFAVGRSRKVADQLHCRASGPCGIPLWTTSTHRATRRPVPCGRNQFGRRSSSDTLAALISLTPRSGGGSD